MPVAMKDAQCSSLSECAAEHLHRTASLPDNSPSPLLHSTLCTFSASMTKLKKEKPPVPYTTAIFTRRVGKKKRDDESWTKQSYSPEYEMELLWQTLDGVHFQPPNSMIVCSSRFCFTVISKKIRLICDHQVSFFILHVDELWSKQGFQICCTFLSKASLCQAAPSCSLVTSSLCEFEKELGEWEKKKVSLTTLSMSYRLSVCLYLYKLGIKAS